MSETTAIEPTIDQQMKKLCGRLEDVFRHLDVVSALICVVSDSLEGKEPTVVQVMKRCMGDEVWDQMKELTFIVESLGGETDWTEEMERLEGDPPKPPRKRYVTVEEHDDEGNDNDE